MDAEACLLLLQDSVSYSITARPCCMRGSSLKLASVTSEIQRLCDVQRVTEYATMPCKCSVIG